MTIAEFSALILADANAAVSHGVGSRRPCHGLPADPTPDHVVACALGDLLTSARGAYEAGATDSEIELACILARAR